MKTKLGIYVLAIFALFSLASCSSQPMTVRSKSGGDAAFESGAMARQLGTAWGEKIDSTLHYVSFKRERESLPDVSATINYDDRGGVAAAGLKARDAESKPFELLDGALEIGLTDEERGVFSSPFYPGLDRNGQLVVLGEKGRRYGISFRNRSDIRVEVVLSVDGLDVMNGREASYRNRGYIVEPGERLLVEGFRRSEDDVAAFRFSSVAKSYAEQKYGDSSNVGVIGVAVFREEGTSEYELMGKRSKRHGSPNPFPGQFATAP